MGQTFGKAFGEARMASEIIYRDIGTFVGLSIGRLCDIERGRSRPPEIDKVKLMEQCLGITDGRLQKLAEEERAIMATVIYKRFNEEPRLKRMMIEIAQMDEAQLSRLERGIAKLRSEQ